MLSTHLHYDVIKTAHDRLSFTDALKTKLAEHKDFSAVHSDSTAADRVAALLALRSSSNGVGHTLGGFLAGKDPNGNFGVLLAVFKDELAQLKTAHSKLASVIVVAQ